MFYIVCVVWDLGFYFFYFFFSSRRRHTRFSRDWSSDVCSSDLVGIEQRVAPRGDRGHRGGGNRLGGARARHDERVAHQEAGEVERVAEIAEDLRREARRPAGWIPAGKRDERAHHASHARPDRVFKGGDVHLLE